MGIHRPLSFVTAWARRPAAWLVDTRYLTQKAGYICWAFVAYIPLNLESVRKPLDRKGYGSATPFRSRGFRTGF
jgi:hypothetical protein